MSTFQAAFQTTAEQVMGRGAQAVCKGNVAVVDDDQGTLASLVSLLTIDGYCVTGFSSVVAFLDEAAGLSLDCLVTDIRMPQVDGLSLIVRLRTMGLGTIPIVVISGEVDVPVAVTAMQQGAMTVLEKPFPPASLLEAVAMAIQRAAAVVAHPTIPPSPDSRAILDCYETLSPREREVLSHLLSGSSSKVVAIALGISPRTVDVFRANILRKMKVPNIAAVATQVAKAGVRPA